MKLEAKETPALRQIVEEYPVNDATASQCLVHSWNRVQFGSQEYRGSKLSMEKDGSLWVALYRTISTSSILACTHFLENATTRKFLVPLYQSMTPILRKIISREESSFDVGTQSCLHLCC